MGELRESAKSQITAPDNEQYLVILLETGCRRGEAIQLRKDQIVWNEEAVVVKRAPVTKYRRAMIRDIIIPRGGGNPWAELFIDYVERLDHEYLFPRRKRFNRDIAEGHTTGRTVYSRIAEIDTDLCKEDRNLWPHGVRGLTASMLVTEYGFTVQQLMKWFEWTHPGMAIHYTRTRDLAKSMGIRKLPT